MDTLLNDFSLKYMSLYQQACLLEFILKNTDFAIITQDFTGKILTWNKGAELRFGYTAMEIENSNVLFDTKNIASGKINKILAKVNKAGRWQGELTLFCKNGDPFTSPVIIILFLKPSGESVGYSIITRSLTKSENVEQLVKLQLANKDLEESNLKIIEATKQKNAFISNMSHDLRTPLNGIIGFSELMSAGKAGAISPEHKEYLEDILYSARHLLAIINDMLDLAKIESGKMEFHPEVLHMNLIINEIKKIFEKVIQEKNITLQIQIDPTLEICIDQQNFKRVLYNLVSNAFKFLPLKGFVNVNVYPSDGNAFCLEVQDTGIGISEEDMSRLFIPFQQLDNSSHKQYQGTGLGLALSQHIVEAQGGKIWAESILGKGSTFYVQLPYKTAANQQVLIKPTLHQSLSIGPSILIIEDPSMEKTELVDNLVKRGYSVKAANNMDEALEQYKVSKFDAIILDLFISDLSKWKLLRAIRTGSPYKKAPSLLIAGAANTSTCVGFKIHDFLLKPIKPKELIDALKWAGANPHTDKKVLIVEEDTAALEVHQKVLGKHGYKTIVEMDLKKALTTVKNEKPDAVVLNLYMETNDFDGFDFLHSIRLSEKSRYIPIVITTLKPLNENDREHIKGNMQRMMMKKPNVSKSLIDEIAEQFPISREIPETVT